MDIEVIFGEILKQHRTEKNMSQEDLALTANLDRTYISMLERGKRQPTISSIFALSDALKIQPSELVRKVELRYTKPTSE